jgi:hypothetical protein
LRQFLQDAMPIGNGKRPRVHSRSYDTDRAAYASEFRSRGASPRTELRAPIAPERAHPVTTPNGKLGRNRPNPALRKHLIPSEFVCNAEDKNLRLLFHEMKNTLIDGHEFANAYMLRAFAERVMQLYLEKVDRNRQAPTKDQALVHRCAEMLDPENKNSKFKPIRTAASNQDASHSLHTLGAAVHTGYSMDRRALISAWTNWEYALAHMLEAFSNH